MARNTSHYACQECGAASNQWMGRCESCGAWNSLIDEPTIAAPPKSMGKGNGRNIGLVSLSGTTDTASHVPTGIAELDRACGGGLVPGSVLLIGGDPGIGKSTLLLQATAALAKNGVACAYVTGEEAINQVRLRAKRLGLEDAPLDVAAATSIRDIVATLDVSQPPKVVVIDSIQTMFVDSLDSAPGTVSQVRGSAQELIRVAKKRGLTIILVGHVTKDGQIAGPRVLEHMVDTVLYFEGERGHQFRILRTVKNRFGATDEIGVFGMTDRGLEEIPNPSALFLGDRDANVSGTSVFAGIEGTRPLLVEIQALTAPTALGTARRAVVGWDSGRLAMVLAVLETRCGISLAGQDVFLNIAGGLKIREPAADLAVAVALISSITSVPVPVRTAVFGEVGLSGEVRSVSQTELRIKEATKLGFSRVIAPKGSKSGAGTVIEIARLEELVVMLSSADTARITSVS
ncbi:MAG: DNA repair protein RadA [Proteobacteria bacterium]|nr:DNA repair protein RadA [Pseudomonadota bacterium]